VSMRDEQCVGYGVCSGHLRNFDAEDNQAFSASLTDRRLF